MTICEYHKPAESYDKEWKSLEAESNLSKKVMSKAIKFAIGLTTGSVILGLGFSNIFKDTTSTHAHKMSPQAKAAFAAVAGSASLGILAEVLRKHLINSLKFQYVVCRDSGRTKKQCATILNKIIDYNPTYSKNKIAQ